MDAVRSTRRCTPAAGGARRAAATIVLAVLASLLLAAEAQAYVPGQLIWAKRIGTSKSPAGAYAVAAGPNGVTAIAGYRYIPEGAGYNLPLVARYTAAGTRAWLKTYTAYEGYAEAVAFDRGGNVYVAVDVWRQRSDSEWGYDIGLLKYSAGGALQWERFYDDPAARDDEAVAIAVDRSGNVVVAGSSPTADDRLGVVVLKYRPNGDPAWPTAARFDPAPGDPNAGDVCCTGLALDSVGNAYVTGWSNYYSAGTWLSNALTLKFAATDGARQWGQIYEARHNPSSSADAIAVRGSSVVVTGSTGGATDANDALVVKYGLDGTERYWKEWGVDNGRGERFAGVALDGKGNVFVTGDQWVGEWTATDKAITLKLNATLGKVVWKKTYQPSGMYAQGWFLTRDGLGNVYVSGVREHAPGTRDEDLLTVKYGPTGKRLWLRSWCGGGPDDDWPYGIVVGTKGGVHVAAWVTGKDAGNDYVCQAALLKYQE